MRRRGVVLCEQGSELLLVSEVLSVGVGGLLGVELLR